MTTSFKLSQIVCLLAGPGLAVRVLGDVTQGDALDVLRQVDEVYVQCIRDYGLYDKIWQAFAVFLPVRQVHLTLHICTKHYPMCWCTALDTGVAGYILVFKHSPH